MPTPWTSLSRLLQAGFSLLTCGVFREVHADLPVHCLHHQILGNWQFYLGPLSSERQSCGHLSPDHEDYQPSVRLNEVAREVQVDLQHPNLASSSADKDGRWTMIYDEGFEVNVEGLSLFAFSRFDLHSSGEVRFNVSRCGETQLGWYHTNDRTQWGCYYATKLTNQQAQHHAGLVSYKPGRPEKSSTYYEPLNDQFHNTVVDILNSVQGAWQAKAHAWYTGKSLREMNDMAGLYRSLPVSSQKGLTHGNEQRPATFLQRSSSHQLRAVETQQLPASWDWRDIDGVNYIDEVLDQGECGSCYMVSTIHMLSARHRIQQGNASLEAFSIAFPLYCSEYNQGCEGGYAFLATKWSQDVGLVPKSCLAYADIEGKCDLQCDPHQLPRRHRATNHHYVGGYYGGSSEEEIMRELVEGGPLVASFEPSNDLMYYSGGVYKRVPHMQHAEWEQVDHAVMLVGYGEDEGKKYWILQNSWGKDWGEDGYFRMARGIDESGVESLVVSADVVEEERPHVLLQFVSEPAHVSHAAGSV
mmetsp:Transcript_52768/g.123418  ORF Transcript_52768/g.123418 Transcript_52768/m.123418 type:complete len:528 (+) Transcript_52768:53-1636(+)